MATVDVHGRYVIPCRGFCRIIIYVHKAHVWDLYTMRGLSALSVLTVWAMREPRYRGTGSSKIPTLFHFVEGTY